MEKSIEKPKAAPVYLLTHAERTVVLSMQSAVIAAQKQLEGALLMLSNSHGLVGSVVLSADMTRLEVQE